MVLIAVVFFYVLTIVHKRILLYILLAISVLTGGEHTAV